MSPLPLAFTPRALLVDMDGLLVDSEPLWFSCERELARRRGGEWTEAQARACMGGGIERTLARMAEQLGFEIDLAQAVAEVEDLFLARAGGLAPAPFARELLAAARGRRPALPLALASSSSRRVVRGVLEATGLGPCFDAVLTGSDVAERKPAPDLFVAAARALGFEDARGCAVLEDSLNGMAAGRAAGAFVVGVVGPEHRGPEHARLAGVLCADLREAARCLGLFADR